MEEKEQELQAKIEALQADNDFTNERLTALQGKLANPEIDLIWFFFFLPVKYLLLGLLFTVRLEHLQEKTLKECSSLGRCHHISYLKVNFIIKLLMFTVTLGTHIL